MHGIALYSILLCFIVLYCIVLDCIVLNVTVLHDITLYCSVCRLFHCRYIIPSISTALYGHFFVLNCIVILVKNAIALTELSLLITLSHHILHNLSTIWTTASKERHLLTLSAR